MSFLRFEKWFLDVLTPDREYILIFHTVTRVLGRQICFVEINAGSLDGDRPGFHLNRKLRVTRREGHTLTAREGHILYEEGMGRIVLPLPGMEIELNVSPTHPSDFNRRGMIIRNQGGGSLDWKPLYIKAMVTGRIRREGELRKIAGIGYADYLFSDISPLRVPVRELYWGRLHSHDLDLTWSHALGSGSEVLASRLILFTGGREIILEELTVEPGRWRDYDPPGISCPESFSIRGTAGEIDLRMKVRHLKPAVISEFIENPKDLGRLKHQLLKKISKDPRGIKFFSEADVELSYPDRNMQLSDLLMIDEYVIFA